MSFKLKIYFLILIVSPLAFLFQACSLDPLTEPSGENTMIDKSSDYAANADGTSGGVDYSSERETCEGKGWVKHTVDVEVGGKIYKRKFLVNAPESGIWTGSILVFHGGGGNYTDWCVGSGDWSALAEEAIDRGYGVFLLDSLDSITDKEGHLCGKVWDDKVLTRDNFDLPYITEIIEGEIPKLRPANSGSNVFATGFSSGGFMTTRAGTSLNHLITAFAPVASGSPYGWHRDCSQTSGRPLVNGKGIDNDSLLEITILNSCGSYIYDPSTNFPGEVSWENGGGSLSSVRYLKLHHYYDGITDFSCHQKVRNRLYNNGYQGDQFVSSQDHFGLGANRHVNYHWYFQEYVEPTLDFFDSL